VLVRSGFGRALALRLPQEDRPQAPAPRVPILVRNHSESLQEIADRFFDEFFLV